MNDTICHQLENDFKSKFSQLQSLKKQYEFQRHENEQKHEHYQQFLSPRLQSIDNQEFIKVQKEHIELKKTQAHLARTLKEQHTLILNREKKCQTLVKMVQEAKNQQQEGHSVLSQRDKVTVQEQKLILTQKKLHEAQLNKKRIETGYMKQIQQINQHIKSAQLDAKMLELRLKDKDNALKSSYYRQKELQSIIDEFKKIKKQEQRKARHLAVLQQPLMIEYKQEEEPLIQEQPYQQQPVQHIEEFRKPRFMSEEEPSNFFGLTQVEEQPTYQLEDDKKEFNINYQSYQEQAQQQAADILANEQIDINDQSDLDTARKIERNLLNLNSSLMFQAKASPITRYDSQDYLGQIE